MQLINSISIHTERLQPFLSSVPQPITPLVNSILKLWRNKYKL